MKREQAGARRLKIHARDLFRRTESKFLRKQIGKSIEDGSLYKKQY